MACVGIELDVCNAYLVSSQEKCLFDPFYEAVLNESVQLIQEKGRVYGMCVSKTFLAKAGASDESLEKCMSKFPKPRPVQ